VFIVIVKNYIVTYAKVGTVSISTATLCQCNVSSSEFIPSYGQLAKGHFIISYPHCRPHKYKLSGEEAEKLYQLHITNVIIRCLCGDIL
jgi:hypothetical protein